MPELTNRIYDVKVYVFGRHTAAPHARLGEVALECTRHPEESIQAIGWNLLCDHRVSESRAAQFFEVMGRPASVDELNKALVDYHRDWVCRQPDETYLSRAYNGENFVPVSHLRKDLELVTVINASAWVNRLKTLPSVGLRLEAALRRITGALVWTGEIESFLVQLLEAVNAYRDRRPIWVARWEEFQRSIEADRPETWNAGVGVWRMRGAWQMALRYPVTAVPSLIRPTQLDSGFNQYHFPSPPLRPARGGFTMALRELPGRPPLVPEWIHTPIDFHIDHWKASSLPGGRIGDDGSAGVLFYRRLHRERLERRFPKEISGWIPTL